MIKTDLHKRLIKRILLFYVLAGISFSYIFAAVGTSPMSSTMPSSGLKGDTNILIQNVTFPKSIDTVIFGVANYDPGAVASSGLPVTYTSLDTNIISIIENKVHLKKLGTDTIIANQDICISLKTG